MPRPDVSQLLADSLFREAPPAYAFFPARPFRIRTAPARLDVLGALGADAGSTVAQMALPARVAVAVQFTDAPTLALQCEPLAPSHTPHQLCLPLTATTPPAAYPWAAPILALWHTLSVAEPDHLPGAVIRIHSAIPTNACQASTTALLSALALALTELRQRPLDLPDLALAIERAESHTTAPALHNGRVLDALTCLLAESGTMLRYSAQPHRLVGSVPIPRDLRILALDTGVPSATSAETLDDLRIAGALGLRIIDTIYKDLGQTHTPLHGYLANTSPLLYRQYFRTLLPKRLRGQDFTRTYGPLPENTGPLDPAKLYRVRAAVDHQIAEHEHAEQFLQAMEELDDMPGWGDRQEEVERQRTLQRAGRLALASHHSYRLRLELSCREADWLVDHLMEYGPDRGIYGARITGRGGGGTVMALVDRGQTATDAILDVMQAYAREMSLHLGISEAGASGSVEMDGRVE
jgi:galactokinase